MDCKVHAGKLLREMPNLRFQPLEQYFLLRIHLGVLIVLVGKAHFGEPPYTSSHIDHGFKWSAFFVFRFAAVFFFSGRIAPVDDGQSQVIQSLLHDGPIGIGV